MIRATVYVCRKRVVNSFSSPSDLYLSGLEKPLKVWIAVPEIKAGQFLIVVRAEKDVAIYLLGEDERTLQISGTSDLLMDADWIVNPSHQWVVAKRMASAILRHSFRLLSINEITKRADELKAFENGALEFILNQECNNWSKCKALVIEYALGITNKPLSTFLALAAKSAGKPPKSELNRQVIESN